MKVKTINPVIVNGKRESEPSKYLSANGKGEYETTLQDVSSQKDDNFYGANAKGEFETTLDDVASQKFDNYYGANGDDEYYNADGDDYFDFDGKKASKAQLKKFQEYANKKGMSPKLVVDGVYGKNTQLAIDKYGAEWDAMLATVMGLAVPPPSPMPTDTPTPTPQEQVEMAKKGKIWDKVKGWQESGKAQELLGKVQEAGGIRGFFGGLFGKKGGAGAPPTDMPIDNSGGGDSSPSGKPGMSKGMKIGLAVGGAVLLFTIIYFATRNKGVPATTK